MRLSALAAVAAVDFLSGTPWMMTESYCRGNGGATRCYWNGKISTQFGIWGVDAASGCASRDIEKMEEFCIDNNRGRAYFRFGAQRNMTCLERGLLHDFRCHRPRPRRRRKPRNPRCQFALWKEVPCRAPQIERHLMGKPVSEGERV
ncbi:hypothetical protein CDD80_545 [Ophiocordyceps camponoti-rufipedis]|uniref:Uncharacterized protein n=1 Tax=Ophiocordyceps camponoti-rufipedis TaxID=2004952 RepID=A0A2C5ZE69_9HYPO|nr:hypothetical protein CDD80_545 [Ophiocordyceps camponoti-rufipedis]